MIHPPKPTDVQVTGARLYLLPVETRVPLKFGTETLTRVTCARVSVMVRDGRGITAEGWGETPLSVQWVWPSSISYEQREATLIDLTKRLVARIPGPRSGHAFELGHTFIEQELPLALTEVNDGRTEPVPHLAALVCASAIDLALHDAYGQVHEVPTYDTYDARFMNVDLSHYLPAEGGVSFAGKYPADFLRRTAPSCLPAWHLVGGLDPLDKADLRGDEPRDDHPVLLADWLRRDGLRCLKIKLRGNDAAWDLARIKAVGAIARSQGAVHISLDYNCTVQDPQYVAQMLDRLCADDPALFDSILYVEQPFPYDLERHQIDVRQVAARKPLFMDESAHNWRFVRLGRKLGWTGVALKTCKTQTGALLSACWARAHGMDLMVQDLTNPMLAMIPHALLAAHVGTIMGIETNQGQFYPEASAPEAAVHPGLFRRRDGQIELSTLQGPGFGYRVNEIRRTLPPPAAVAGDAT